MIHIYDTLSKKEIKQRVSYLKTKGITCPNVSKLRGNAPEEMFLEEYKKDIQQLLSDARNIISEISKANPPKQREIIECDAFVAWDPRGYRFLSFDQKVDMTSKQWNETLGGTLKRLMSYFTEKTSKSPNEIIVNDGIVKTYFEKLKDYDGNTMTFDGIKVIFKDCTSEVIKICNVQEDYSIGIKLPKDF